MGRTGKYAIGLLLALVMLFSLSAVASADGAPDLSGRTPIVVTATSNYGVYGTIATNGNVGGEAPQGEDNCWAPTKQGGSWPDSYFLNVVLHGLKKDDILKIELLDTESIPDGYSLNKNLYFYEEFKFEGNEWYFSFPDLVSLWGEEDVILGLEDEGSLPTLNLNVNQVNEEVKFKARITVYRLNTELSQEPASISAATDGITETFDTVEAAIADDNTTTATTFTIPADKTLGGVVISSGSMVTVSEVAKSDNVTAKEVSITKDGTTQKVYVLTDGNNTIAFSDPQATISGSQETASSYIDVAKSMANAVAQNSIQIDQINSSFTTLSLQKTPVGENNKLPETVSNQVSSYTSAYEVHPELHVTYLVDGAPQGHATYKVPNEDLAAGASFPVSLTGLDDSKTYTIYHYAVDGALKDTFADQKPVDGKITLSLNSFSWLLISANDGTVPTVSNNKAVNSVYRTYMNLQTNLFLNYQLYLTGDTSSTDYAQNGKLQLSYDGNSYEIDLNSVGAYSESAMRIGVATNGFYCGRHYVEGSPSSWYYVSFGVFPNKMDAACTVKVLKADGSETPLYLNTNTGATGISSAVLQSLVNNTYSTTVNSFEDSLLARYAAGTADYTLAEMVKAYGAAAAVKYGN